MTLTGEQLRDLKELALRVREHCIRMARDGGCFLGASLSCTDLIVYLYRHVLRIDPVRPTAPERDYFLLSKGHDVPALYGTFAELGIIPRERLAHHLALDDDLYWHPNRNVPGVEYYSGSLGHLLAVAIGVALDFRLRGLANRVFVLLGDGELDEGSVWEGILVAAAKRLDNLVAVVDRNAFQANVPTEDLIPLEPLEEKFRAFGWEATRVDGHDFPALHDTFTGLGAGDGRPRVVIADTVRGKGLPSIERRADRWFCSFTADEVAQLLRELHGEGPSELSSEARIVR
jgi:transketolase